VLFACTQRNISYCSAPPSGRMEQVEHGTFRSRPPAGAGVGSAAVSEGGVCKYAVSISEYHMK